MYEVGRPAEWVNEQKWRRRASGTLHAAGAAAAGAVAAASVLAVAFAGAPYWRALAAVSAVAAAGGCWYLSTRAAALLKQAGQAAIGVRSEREVRTVIRRTGSIAVGYGLMLADRGGDCDVVVFTRHGGAVAVEVKTGHGAVAVEGGTMRVGRRRLRNDPARQAENQARRLSRRLGRRPVLAVVCVPGMTNRAFTTGAGVWVCSKGDLAGVLKRAPRVFDSPAEAEQMMKRLGRQRTS